MRRAIVLLVGLLFTFEAIGSPSFGKTTVRAVVSHRAQAETPRVSAAQKKAEELAATLAASKTDEERAALIERDKESVTKELVGALNEQGKRLLGLKDYTQALAVHNLALKIAERLDDKAGIANSLLNIGSTYQWQGSYPQALEFFQKALTASEAAGDKLLEGAARSGAGTIYRLQSNFTQALEYHLRNVKLYEELGNKKGIAQAQSNVGLIYHVQAKNAEASEYLQKSLKLYEELEDKVGTAWTLINLADTLLATGDIARALEYAQRALKLAEESQTKALIAQALNEVGIVQQRLGNTDQALEYFRKSLELSEEVGDKFAVGLRLMNIGVIYQTRGDLDPALEYFQKSLKVSEEIGNRAGAANASVKIGNNYRFRGDYTQSLIYFQRSLKLFEELQIKDGVANTLTDIGNIYRLQGNFAQALGYFQRGLKLNEELQSKGGIAFALHRIGMIHYGLGDYPTALEYFQKALKLREEIADKGRIADSLNTIGIIYYETNNYAQALDYFGRSLTIMRQIGDKRGSVIAQGNTAEIYAKQGHYEQALSIYQENLKALEAMGDKELLSTTLGNLGDAYRLQGDYSQALKPAVRAADIARQAGLREQLWNALEVEGRAFRSLDDLDNARRALEEAIGVVESVRVDISGEEGRASYFAKVRELYELYTDLLMELDKRHPNEGLAAEALQASERGRARSLLEILVEARADIRQGVDRDVLARERSLRQRLNDAAGRQTRLLAGKHTEEQATAASGEVAELTQSLQATEAEVRLKSPRYAALTRPVPLGLREIQQQLDADTMLLEYELGEERSYLWAVTPTEIKSFELPMRAEVEKSAKEVYGLLTERNHIIKGETDEQRRARISDSAAKYDDEAARLGRMVIAPAASMLGTKRLLVVADGVLQYIPFGALPDPATNHVGREGLPLAIAHEIVSLPSASVLAALRHEFDGRHPAPKAIAVLADPVFGAEDERVKKPTTAVGSGTRSARETSASVEGVGDGQAASRFTLERAFNLQPSTGESGSVRGEGFPRLFFTRWEAEAIIKTSPAGAGLRALDFTASRATATGDELSHYRIVHFATHGILNGEHPELSGVVLSLVDEGGRAQDGFLRLHDIYNLKLNAELVVLSACQTALGKEVKGEGLIGLTRGFMYAGSPRVVASLWKVDDAATAELMKLFYKGMLKDKLPPAKALHDAQVAMWRQKNWRAPYYWAAFQLQGEWR